jgi:RNA polymerase sigma-70 factor (ECF subfamily)
VTCLAEPALPAGEPDVVALVERARAGDREAFGALYDRYADDVFRFVYHRTGHRQLAEDITADTWLRALRSIGRFEWQGRDFSAWLVTIARNLAADHFKSHRYRRASPYDLAELELVDDDHDPAELAAQLAAGVQLRRAVDRLSTADQQQVIELRFFRGLSVAETAAVMGRRENAVKALQYRATQALARDPAFGNRASWVMR